MEFAAPRYTSEPFPPYRFRPGANPHPTADEVRHGLDGNLCRCTGYQNIVKSVLAAAEKMGG